MSYARWGSGSSVYVFAHVDGFVQCCGCLLRGSDSADLTSAADVSVHMREHVDAGHTVPAELLDESLYAAEDFRPYVRPVRKRSGTQPHAEPIGDVKIERLP